MKNNLFALSLVGILSLTIAACNTENGDIVGRRTLKTKEAPPLEEGKTVERYTPKWITLDAGNGSLDFNPRVDILFVVDNSESMKSAQENLSKNMNSFVRSFSKNKMIDYHIGVISVWDSSKRYADNKKDPYKKGELRYVKASQKQTQNARFITPSDKAGDLLAASLKLGVISYDDGGPEIEEVFSPLAAALTQTSAGEPNADFFRDDAQLVVVIITDADDTVSNDPSKVGEGLTPDAMARKLFEFKERHGGKDKVSVYAALVTNSDDDSKKDFGLRIHPTYHPECFSKDQTRPKPEGCKIGFGPDRIEQFVFLANQERVASLETNVKFIMSLTQTDFGVDLGKIGSDISARTLAKEIELPSQVRLDDKTNLPMIRVTYGTPEALEKGEGQVIPPGEKGWKLDTDRWVIKISGEVAYVYQEGARFQVQLVPLNFKPSGK